MNPLYRLFFSAVLGAASVASAHAKIERMVERTFTVSPSGTVHLATQGGNIQVQPAAAGDSTVKVTARERINADSEAEADEILRKLTLTIEQNGNDVTAT